MTRPARPRCAQPSQFISPDRALQIGLIACVAVWVGAATGCSPATTPENSARAVSTSQNVDAADAMVQYSLLAALAAGDYEQGAELRTVMTKGDFGIGTFDRLDGEMILLEGKMYQALGDGNLRPADLAGTTPFAAVKFFQADGQLKQLSATSLEDLDEQLDRKLPRRNSPYALRLDGEFAELTLRSVPAQSPPYQRLVNVVKHQHTWQVRKVRGTLVGFRCPNWVGTLNVPGYHWHFLSDDRTSGGHVLACEFREGSLEFDECNAVLIELPNSAAFDRFGIDDVKAQDIDHIERQRTDK